MLISASDTCPWKKIAAALLTVSQSDTLLFRCRLFSTFSMESNNETTSSVWISLRLSLSISVGMIIGAAKRPCFMIRRRFMTNDVNWELAGGLLHIRLAAANWIAGIDLVSWSTALIRKNNFWIFEFLNFQKKIRSQGPMLRDHWSGIGN